VLNLKLSGIAAAAGFVLSLLIGVFSGGAFGISLLRALCFGIVFFALGALVWMLINRFIPDLLMPPKDEPLMTGLETGSRVNISVGDDDIPINAALPSENDSKDALGTVADLMARRAVSQAGSQPAGSAPESADDSPLTGPAVLDLGTEEGYSKGGETALPGADPQVSTEEKEAAFVPSPPPATFSGGNMGGDIETLPDLDAMAGAFMSSDEEEEGETTASSSIFGVEPKSRTSGKGKGDDYNPKEVASAIQTILKRD
jgi:hypothetical protein